MLNRLNGNSFSVATVTGKTNPADKPSRNVLNTLHAAARTDLEDDTLHADFFEVLVI